MQPILDLLHDDEIRVVLSFLDVHDLNHLHQSAKSFRFGQLSTEDEFWKKHYHRKFEETKRLASIRLYAYETRSTREIVHPMFSQQRSDHFKQHLIELYYEIESECDKNMKALSCALKKFEKEAPRPHPFVSKDNVKKSFNTNELYQEMLGLEKKIKVVFVGDGAVGKTTLIYANERGRYEDYIPNIFCSNYFSVACGDKYLEIDVFDTAGQEE